MIDIHAHVLPGVDDGPDTLEESITLVRSAVEQGVTKIIATPHHRPPRYDPKNVEEAYRLLKNRIKELNIPLELYLGREVYSDLNLIDMLQDIKPLNMVDSDYILLELPSLKIYPTHYTIFDELLQRNYRVVLAHIEKYPYLIDDYETLSYLIKLGFHTQINAKFVVTQTKKAIRAIKAGHVHIVASDAHDMNKRRYQLKEAYRIIARKLGTKIADQLFLENPNRVLNNQPLQVVLGEREKLSLIQRILCQI